MSWKIEEHITDNHIYADIQIADGHHIYYANTITLDELEQYTHLTSSDLFETTSTGRLCYDTSDKIFVCRARKTDSSTETQKKIPVNAIDDPCNGNRYIWFILTYELDSDKKHLVKRTSNKVSDVHPKNVSLSKKNK